jgi:Carboxypeptidase regulatory-like domain
MSKKWLVCLAVLTFAVGFALSAFAQESAVKGAISGVVLDTTGAAVPGAKVTLSGPMGERSTVSDASGTFTFATLIPGFYNVRTEKENFKAATVSDIQVLVDHTSAIRVTLEPGAITQTINVTAAAEAVDTTSTAVTSNFNTTFYQLIPIQRGVASLMYLAPGTKSGLGTGVANPSISGGTGLENQYVADGVSITDTAFGGLGVYNRLYGSLGTGLDLSFIQELDVKTGGYEPQYGGATGGFVQIVTKAGGREYHGGISAFYAPKQFQEKPRNPNDFGVFNKFSNLVGNTTEDISGELGGYVPGMRNHLFFYGAMDPSETLNVVNIPAPIGLSALGNINDRIVTYNYDAKLTWRLNDNHTVEGSVFGDPSHTNNSAFRSTVVGNGPGFVPDTRRYSKLTYGDRDWAVRYNGTLSPTWLVNADFTWMHNTFTETPGSTAYRISNLTETGINGIAVPGQLGSFTQGGVGFLEDTDDETFKSDISTSKTFSFWGSQTFSFGASLARTFYDGTRTASGPIVGMPGDNANNEVANGNGTCFGQAFSCMSFSTNSDPFFFCSICVGSPTYWEFTELVASPTAANGGPCTLCPLANIPGYDTPQPVYLFADRAEFGLSGTGKSFGTNGTFVASYVNDSWTINKYLTINAGLRWQNQRLQGVNTNFTFTDNWEPRIGVVIDPRGDRKNKIFAGFNRYSYAIPLDLAERSLTNELDLFGFNFAPAFTVNSSGQRIATLDQFGAVIPVVDNSHVINTDNGGVSGFTFGSTESQEAIFPGTRMSMEDEWVLGAEHQFPHGIVLSAKFLRRDLKRIVEDTGGIPPEAALSGGITQQFAITNISSTTDIFNNPIEFIGPQVSFNSDGTAFIAAGAPGPAETPGYDACLGIGSGSAPAGAVLPSVISVASGATLGGACFLPTSVNGGTPGAISRKGDGVPDGFPDPVRQYWAMEFEVNKAFSNGWQLRANWTISRLFGNFEGAFRNDNGQSDPSISSLYDFTQGDYGLLGGQFVPGLLNTDRTHVVNIYTTYVFQNGWKKGLTIGSGVRFQTGIPLTDLLPHPVYDNAGEVPNLTDGGRGGLGRSAPTGTVDLHVDYPWRMTERQRLHFGVDLFNLADSRRSLIINQNNGLEFTGTVVVPNADFKKPANVGSGALGAGSGFVAPFNARISVRWQF